MILNYGSLNIDHVYQVPHFVTPGETLSSDNYETFAGGKGANQSMALARAGAQVKHAGKLGRDGEWLKQKLAAAGVDVSATAIVDEPSGHAIIQVNSDGENSIILFGGANQLIDAEHLEVAFGNCGTDDVLLLQNEINPEIVPTMMQRAADLGMRIALNPAPMNERVSDFPIELVGLLIVNEVEARQLAGVADPEAALATIRGRWPDTDVVMTLGRQGVIYSGRDEFVRAPSHEVKAVDTTAAGDTFIGYFLAALDTGAGVEPALQRATAAAALCVTRSGAMTAIPTISEVDTFISQGEQV